MTRGKVIEKKFTYSLTQQLASQAITAGNAFSDIRLSNFSKSDIGALLIIIRSSTSNASGGKN